MSTELLTLSGLRLGSPQTMGAIRLVPVLRDDCPGDLRIGARKYGPSLGYVGLDSRPEEAGTKYLSYIPHGLVVAYREDGTEASLGTSLGDNTPPSFVKLHHRMVKAEASSEEGTKAFRMLPLHLAMEGYLALHFGGPSTLWSEYSEEATRYGLSPRYERSVRGTWIQGLAQALSVFEIHDRQVGIIAFVADALAAANVLSHPDDYRRIHVSLLEDFFGELLYAYAMLHPELARTEAPLDVSSVTSWDTLEVAMERVRADFHAHAELMVQGLFGRPVEIEVVRSMRAFTLQRFLPEFDPNEECHIGERIVRADGTLEYMKTFRLSHAQVRRAFLLKTLASVEWNVAAAAIKLGTTTKDFLQRMVNAGFGYVLKPHIVRGLT